MGCVRVGNDVTDALAKDKEDSALYRVFTSKLLKSPITQVIVEVPISDASKLR